MCGKGNMGQKCEASGSAHVRAGGLRGRRVRRQGRGALRSRLQRDPGLRARPRLDTAIHMRSNAARGARGNE
jgi:hypothetical protein